MRGSGVRISYSPPFTFYVAMNRPYTTLFLLVSVDGKISTGDVDTLDVDKDYPKIEGLKEGLNQYYDLEMKTDLFSLNTGRVFAKIGINERTDEPEKSSVSFIVIDNKPNLTDKGVVYLAKKVKNLIIATTSESHPAFALKGSLENVHVLKYESRIDFHNLFERISEQFGAERMTIQSGGTLNATLVREGLIDRVLLVVAPALIGGKDTATLMDGESLHNASDIGKIVTLELVQAKPLENSYLILEYKVKSGKGSESVQ